ncbi:UbiA-like protein EboC [Mucilaginibacter sp. CAU 1740]|uniref:UbiA-like protein EboC n=1 Tax=Mucilaginibacter sp. CAU 1740 TaxID=3140365 RepID=UPI00325AF560
MRPANIVTSVADILAGIAIVSVPVSSIRAFWPAILLLCLSTACLYGGGIVFNDVFDVELDKIERPERAIPSGKVSLREATVLGSILLCTGILSALFVSIVSGLIAAAIALCALLYDRFGKHHPFFGPLNMGMCRGLNLLLGISIIPIALINWFMLALVPVAYIFSITLTSRGEVHGGSKSSLYTAATLYAGVIGFISYFSYANNRLLWSLLFLIPFTWMIFRPLLKAIREPIGKNIGKAVKAGVISLILMDASWSATFGSLTFAVLIACLLPLSIWFAKTFAVT